MSEVSGLESSGGMQSLPPLENLREVDLSESLDAAQLRAAVESLCRQQDSGQPECALSPHDLASATAADVDSQSAGMEAYVEGFIRQMLLDGLKKAGKPDTEGW